MANAIIGEWEYCPDGVELFEWKPGGGPFGQFFPENARRVEFGEIDRKWPPGGQISNGVLRYRTERREKKRLEMENIKGPTVVEFVNAKPPEQLIAFLGDYGLPETSNEQMPADDLIIMQRRMEDLLNTYSAGEIAQCVTSFDRIIPDLSIRPDLKLRRGNDSDEVLMTLRCSNLAGFMTMELAAIMADNAQVLRCIHCNNVFTAGVGGARKKTAHYCSNRCRVAAQRATAKAKQAKAGE